MNENNKSITIKELADILGLAHSTVSRALNNNPVINIKTRQVIQEKAAQLGYIPNYAARLLKNRTSNIVGLIIPDINNHFYTTVAKTIADATAEHSLHLILSTTEDNPEREAAALYNLLEVRAKGVIIVPSQNPSAQTRDYLNKINHIQLNRYINSINSPRVTINDKKGIDLATSHLLNLGHRHIAYIGALSSLSSGSRRLEGFIEAFRRKKITVDKQLVKQGPPRPKFAQQAFQELFSLSTPPSALILGSADIALPILAMAKQLSITIPEQLSLVAYGDLGWYNIWQQGITTLALPEQKMADRCVQLLLQQIDHTSQTDEPGSDLRHSHFEPKLIIRGSTARYTADKSSR